MARSNRRVLAAAAVALFALCSGSACTVGRSQAEERSDPPPAGGWFTLEPVGSYGSLPDDDRAAAMVHRSSWEPRPENRRYNETVPAELALVRKEDADRAYDTRWNTDVLGRITGAFSGTTDEIFQWAAAKWGIPDDVLRSVAVMETGWKQAHFGDYVDDASACPEQGSALPCPVTFGIVGVRSTSWPGVYPWNRDSTAVAVDVLGGWLRGCFEGWVWWLRDHGNRSRGTYAPGDLWGCVGAWYSGDWHDGDIHAHSGEEYIHRAQQWYGTKPWLRSGF